MKPSEDFLAIFENRLRNEGIWCDVGVSQKLRHYFIARNPKIDMAISMCGSLVVTFDKLHENTMSQKCLICDLYLSARKEVQERLHHNLETIVQETVNQPTNQ